MAFRHIVGNLARVGRLPRLSGTQNSLRQSGFLRCHWHIPALLGHGIMPGATLEVASASRGYTCEDGQSSNLGATSCFDCGTGTSALAGDGSCTTCTLVIGVVGLATRYPWQLCCLGETELLRSLRPRVLCRDWAAKGKSQFLGLTGWRYVAVRKMRVCPSATPASLATTRREAWMCLKYIV